MKRVLPGSGAETPSQNIARLFPHYRARHYSLDIAILRLHNLPIVTHSRNITIY